MDRKNVLRLLLAFVLGVLLTLLLTSGSGDGRYVPFGSTGERILDTRTGRVYAEVAGKHTWLVVMQGVNKK